MNWGIGLGYSGLYQENNQQQRTKNELGTLQMLSQQMKSDAAEKEQADLKEAAYQEQITKFADQLLAPDRDRINKQASVLSSMIKDHIKANGGDMTKFFQNGGHKVMSQYRQAVTGSKEAGVYMENKKNMERIVEMQMKGFGHLINKTDLYNLENYQNSGEGKITFTGMLNQIETPDLNNFDDGKTIDVNAILHHNQNYTKFLGNYKMTYPTAPFPPTEKELLGFVAQSHGDLKGTNWQKGFQYQKEANDEAYRKASFDTQQAQWMADFKQRQQDTEFNQNLQLENLELDKYQAGLESQFGPGVNSKSATQDAKDLAEAQGNFAYDGQYMMDNIQDRMNNGEVMGDKIWDHNAKLFGKASFEKFEDYAKDYAENGDGGILDTTGNARQMTKNLFTNAYVPRASKTIFQGAETEAAIKEMGILNFDPKSNGFKLNANQIRNYYDAKGVKIENWSTGPNEKGMIIKNYGETINNRTWNARGVIGAFVGSDKNNNDQMIMDVRGGSGKGKRDESKTKDFDSRMNNKSGKKPQLMAVLESKEGDRVYMPLDSYSTQTLFSKWAGANTNAVKQQRTWANKEATALQSKLKNDMAAVPLIYQQLQKDPQTAKRISAAGNKIPGASINPGRFSALTTSYYLWQNTVLNKSIGNVNTADLANQDLFGQAILNRINTNDESSLRKLVQNKNASDQTVIDFFRDKGYITDEYASDWKNTLNYIKIKK